MPTFSVTHREMKETAVLVEADSREAAKHAVAEAAEADWLSKNGVDVEHESEQGQ